MLHEKILILKNIGPKRFLIKIPYYFYKKYKEIIIKNQRPRCVFDFVLPNNWQRRQPLKLLINPIKIPNSLYNQLFEKGKQYQNGMFYANGELICIHHKPCNGRWDIDPKTGKQWPYCSPFENLNYNAYGDVRYVWDIGRLQHLMTYAQLFNITKNGDWLQCLIDDLLCFFQQNKFEIGIQWRDALQVAIRLINFIFINDFCFNAKKELTVILNKLIFTHIKTLKSQLTSKSTINNNHILGELCALIISCLYFNHASWAKTLLNKCLRRLKYELSYQIYPDGVPYEGTIPYMRFILEFLLLTLHTMDKSKYPKPEWLVTKTNNIAIALSKLCDFKGRIPPIGDGDDGTVLRLDNKSYLNVSEVLTIAEKSLNLPKLNPLSLLERGASLWFFDNILLNKNFTTKLSHHYVLPNAKLFHYQNGALDLWLDAGPTGLGINGVGGHGHNDTTSIVIHYSDIGILHDPGWYSYFVDINKRNAYRCSNAHNIITINDQEQARLGSNFYIFPDIQHSFLKTKVSKNNKIFVFCGHDGYHRLPEKPILSRFLCIIEDEKNIIIKVVDKVFSKKPLKKVQSNLGTDCNWRKESLTSYSLTQSKKYFLLTLPESANNIVYEDKLFSRVTGEEKVGHKFNWNITYKKYYLYQSNWSLIIKNN